MQIMTYVLPHTVPALMLQVTTAQQPLDNTLLLGAQDMYAAGPDTGYYIYIYI